MEVQFMWTKSKCGYHWQGQQTFHSFFLSFPPILFGEFWDTEHGLCIIDIFLITAQLSNRIWMEMSKCTHLRCVYECVCVQRKQSCNTNPTLHSLAGWQYSRVTQWKQVLKSLHPTSPCICGDGGREQQTLNTNYIMAMHRLLFKHRQCT